jgi:putative flippase GtrA
VSERSGLPAELGRFAAVGGAGFLLDVGTFNLLLAALAAHHVHDAAIFAKVVSSAVAIAANWIGNRLWTFRQGRRDDVAREAAEFVAVSIVGGGIALLCLWVSHDLLGLTSPLADNVSANGVGLLLGSAFRFAGYRAWVFSRTRAAA